MLLFIVVRMICLLCSNYPLCGSLSIIRAENFCKAKIRNFRIHVLIQQNVASLKVSVYNAQPRVLVEIQKTLGYPFDYHTSFSPNNQICSVSICTLERAIYSMKKAMKVWLNNSMHTKYKEVQALISQIFVDQKFFLSLNATSHQLDKIIVL
jgi:hypothetical protein